MNQIVVLTLMLGSSLTPVLCWAAKPNAEQAKAIAEIVKLGGKAEFDPHARASQCSVWTWRVEKSPMLTWNISKNTSKC